MRLQIYNFQMKNKYTSVNLGLVYFLNEQYN